MGTDSSPETYLRFFSATKLEDLPKGWTPLEALCVFKCIDESGTAKWAVRHSSGINDEELLGALTIQLELTKREMLADWDEED